MARDGWGRGIFEGRIVGDGKLEVLVLVVIMRTSVKFWTETIKVRERMDGVEWGDGSREDVGEVQLHGLLGNYVREVNINGDYCAWNNSDLLSSLN